METISGSFNSSLAATGQFLAVSGGNPDGCRSTGKGTWTMLIPRDSVNMVDPLGNVIKQYWTRIFNELGAENVELTSDIQ